MNNIVQNALAVDINYARQSNRFRNSTVHERRCSHTNDRELENSLIVPNIGK